MKKILLIKIVSILAYALNLSAWYPSPHLYLYPDFSYDYVRLLPGTEIYIGDGDIVWIEDDYPEWEIYLHTIEGGNPDYQEHNPRSPRCVIGPCTIRNGPYYMNLKIDRVDRRQNKYIGEALTEGDYIILEDGDHAWHVDGNAIEIEYPDDSSETSSYGHDTEIYGPAKIKYTEGEYDSYGNAAMVIVRKAESTGSKTLIYDEASDEYVYSDGTQASYELNHGPDPTSIKYDELFGWAWFTDTNWVYSYTNLSWYYLHPTNEGFYVWNANLPNNGWMLLERG